MTIIFWTLIFALSLFIMVKGADWLLTSSQKIGLAAGLSSFIVGAVIVGAGTSLPEVVSSLVATFKGVTDVPVANAIGSNIANIFLVIGFASVVGKQLTVTKNLINLDLPLLAISTVLFLGVVADREVTPVEALLLLGGYGIYLSYTIFHKEDDADREIPDFDEDEGGNKKRSRPGLTSKDFGLLVVGTLGLVIGAQYLIESVIRLSELLNIATGLIAVTAIAVGTSLPEILVSVKAARQKQSEVALGNIFGSNVFNMLIVVGLPGLFSPLVLDEKTFLIGVPVMALATLLFIISGISKRIYFWEGSFYLILYLFFIGKLFELF